MRGLDHEMSLLRGHNPSPALQPSALLSLSDAVDEEDPDMWRPPTRGVGQVPAAAQLTHLETVAGRLQTAPLPLFQPSQECGTSAAASFERLRSGPFGAGASAGAAGRGAGNVRTGAAGPVATGAGRRRGPRGRRCAAPGAVECGGPSVTRAGRGGAAGWGGRTGRWGWGAGRWGPSVHGFHVRGA